MAKFELVMPKMGESVAEATIINWLKSEGDRIDLEESVLEIATDKVDSEVPSPVEGILVEKLFNENDVVQVGQPVAIIETEGGNGTDTGASSAPAEVKEAVEVAEKQVEEAVATVNGTTGTAEIARNSNGRFYSPLVRSIAEKEGVTQQELDQLDGSGSEGRVTKKDILAYVENRGQAPVAAAASKPVEAKSAPAPEAAKPAANKPILIPSGPKAPVYPGDEIIEI
ncbi:MAG: E3 binding domain-containing protein, partial [Bacteroidota bacterium]|nr:E3 binding domain-containing protein [Bacteroidota bacterium]